MSLFDLSIKEIHKRLKERQVSVKDLVQASIDRIEEVDHNIHAFLTINEEKALKEADILDEANDAEKGLLYGLPVGLKDNIITAGTKTTSGSQMLKDYSPAFDATVVTRLTNAGAITIGKCNMDEFAMGSSNENSSFFPTKNPWDTKRVAGGSSGGPAAAVAAKEVFFALGSDTGGSVRQPSAFCGVVGLKPTYGLVSRFGLVAFASSLDQIGPITKSVEDNAYVLQAIAGHDNMDTTSAKIAVPNYLSSLQGDIRGLKIAVPKEFLGEGVDEGVRQRIHEALATLEKLGATWEEVSMPHVSYAVAAYYILSSAEASANLARYDGIRYGRRSPHATTLEEAYKFSRSEGFGDEVKRRIMLGTYALSAGHYENYYEKAQKVRTLIKEDFENILTTYDVIIGPTAPTTAFKLGEKTKDPLTMYANDLLTIPVNLAGNPAISIPCGFSEGLPVGMQMIGKPFAETTLYKVAHVYEQATNYHKEKPKL
ncbi:Asp-tRNA(Asn)/Glu-tRNA(Gln) amidotransferase GatCAB subunit A [Lottiidibacillus patelloidae]|uniref:Glutamyl-tRNA(Gln) amidotransferase subunit A n=1 Tax=Lottiidibacillus patelloidae TaxID=2670334 RepID=A0A263BT04_9BACI|nr:Asp-tRNA(Asn)/Glu-tRNA(Gln) amidotransferase subunit GatA [Lottiidibacillus patelloidae]OZM56861.1 Asp-tRNA(Asn)/Glu-tRNA(Gln) amidotransferase GatCAB subunit A [Lottiidibacillus patelloidae]